MILTASIRNRKPITRRSCVILLKGFEIKYGKCRQQVKIKISTVTEELPIN